ncbi:ornithine cyclodeaminase family protein [Pacificimonas sp. WHA3]|uniref:Ornithine cyclodeaminase family protein n=1 Tax=Pacificimonas pallii TaxID=2827236 RepID=A0ABS6SA92_9SPHN|nr:ornithine cyclodeaminase family protein [Pacificimonas pallii]MBV7255299.1 ornithine cyclodeaminase family protein [Pacificimonas pallii]
MSRHKENEARSSIPYLGQDVVERLLSEKLAFDLVSEVMQRVAEGTTRQSLRILLPLAEPRLFGCMPGALAADGPFGAKVLSVDPRFALAGASSHQGVVMLFDPDSGLLVSLVDAAEITKRRTAAASAVATEALARPDANRLAILGTGEQAESHIRAITDARSITSVTIWGRSREKAERMAKELGDELGRTIGVAGSAQEAARRADIICTVSGASDPILCRDWVEPGTHINAVGSSHERASEIEETLVASVRYFCDSRQGALAQGGEFIRTNKLGLIGEDHILAEIGDVLSGKAPGRRSADEITLYKSLGHIAQDLACGWRLHQIATTAEPSM